MNIYILSCSVLSAISVSVLVHGMMHYAGGSNPSEIARAKTRVKISGVVLIVSLIGWAIAYAS